jgi:hypothetical protein
MTEEDGPWFLVSAKRALMATHKVRAVCSSLVMVRSRMESSAEPNIQLQTQQSA